MKEPLSGLQFIDHGLQHIFIKQVGGVQLLQREKILVRAVSDMIFFKRRTHFTVKRVL